MDLANVILVFVCIINIELVKSQYPDGPASFENINKEPQLTDNDLLDDHTFVALIDIVFIDGSKRTCTGSIIHNNVVITAAHCFTRDNPDIKPELTASFVVIGAKKMFDTGYEQYLPIERVLTHPKYSGWTADLSLVYTFAGMISDKPGTVIPLAGEKTSTHVDSNVTVLSWGHMRSTEALNDWTEAKPSTMEDDTPCDGSTSQEDDEKNDKCKKKNNKMKVTANLQSRNGHRSNHDIASIALIHKGESKFPTERNPPQTQTRLRQKTQNKLASFRVGSQNTKLISRYLSRQGRMSFRSNNRHPTTLQKDETLQNKVALLDDEEITEPSYDKSTRKHSMTIPDLDSEMETFKSYYKNWRRQMGSQQNQLTVEIFGFVNVQACKKLVEKAMPSRFDISAANDVVCYATEDLFISDEDSGAPAVRRGQLIAVTVGGAEIDGDHVAVGMKMSCYCSWIADNLPAGEGSALNCCNNCCDVKHKEEPKKISRHKNKYLAYTKF